MIKHKILYGQAQKRARQDTLINIVLALLFLGLCLWAFLRHY